MRSLDQLLKNEMDRQQDNLAAKIAEKRNRRKKALAEVDKATADKVRRIEDLEEEKAQLEEEMTDDVFLFAKMYTSTIPSYLLFL